MEGEFIQPLSFCYHPDQKRRFRTGELGPIWAARYPNLFDPDDCRLYRTQCKDAYHFYEWLAAILLYETTGYWSLVQKYGNSNHPRKLGGLEATGTFEKSSRYVRLPRPVCVLAG